MTHHTGRESATASAVQVGRSDLQALEVLEHDVPDALIVSFDVGVGAPFPATTTRTPQVCPVMCCVS